jgi:hypothetical protein
MEYGESGNFKKLFQIPQESQMLVRGDKNLQNNQGIAG